MAEQWFYVNQSGEKIGPMSSRALKTLADSHAISPNSIIIAQSTNKKYEAGKIRGLFESNTPFSSGIFTDNVAQTPEMALEEMRSGVFNPPLPPVLPNLPEAALKDPEFPTLASEGKPLTRGEIKQFFRDNWILTTVFLIVVACFIFSSISGPVYALINYCITGVVDNVSSQFNKPEAAPVVEEDPALVLERKFRSMAKEVVPSLALLECSSGMGNGMVVSPGIVAVNSKLIETHGIGELKLRFPGETQLYSVELLFEEPRENLSLLKVEKAKQKPLPVLASANLASGTEVMVFVYDSVSHVMSDKYARQGTLGSRESVDSRSVYSISLNSPVREVVSGGPVMDSDGNIIGTVLAKKDDSSDAARLYCVPVHTLHNAMVFAQDMSDWEVEQIRKQHHRVFQTLRGEKPDSDDENESEMVVSLTNLSPAEREVAMKESFDRRYKKILAKTKWVYNGTPLEGKIVGFKNGEVLIQLKGSLMTDPPITRLARRFSPGDISDILFYARYHNIPTGNLGR